MIGIYNLYNIFLMVSEYSYIYWL